MGTFAPLKPEVLNPSENDSISVHIITIPRKYGRLLPRAAKHKKISTNRVFNTTRFLP
jgi:hypothetical protein